MGKEKEEMPERGRGEGKGPVSRNAKKLLRDHSRRQACGRCSGNNKQQERTAVHVLGRAVEQPRLQLQGYLVEPAESDGRGRGGV
jgi:NADPH-dependent curcumin reductase CurA